VVSGSIFFAARLKEAVMRTLLVGCALISGALVVLAQSPSVRVIAQEKSSAPPKATQAPSKAALKPASNVDPQKEARIRELMDVTGAKNLGQQLIEAGMEQFRSSVQDSQPNNPRAKQFVDAFVSGFQKHFDVNTLNEQIIPIYDKYLTSDDLKGLLEYYHSPLGQRMLKTLPDLTRESQAAGFALGQKAAQETMEELKTDYPEFTGAKDDDKHPGNEPNN
jgi:hypothetical protein